MEKEALDFSIRPGQRKHDPGIQSKATGSGLPPKASFSIDALLESKKPTVESQKRFQAESSGFQVPISPVPPASSATMHPGTSSAIYPNISQIPMHIRHHFQPHCSPIQFHQLPVNLPQPFGILLGQQGIFGVPGPVTAVPLSPQAHPRFVAPSLKDVFRLRGGIQVPMLPMSVSTLEKRNITGTGKPPPVKKYKCDVCGKAFSRSNTLVTHKRIHTGEKPFKCEHCGRAFRQPGNLTRHRLTHTTVKPYICSQCGKAFNRASNLHTHIRTHTNYRPYVCPFCGKGFHQKIDMKIHSYSHTDLDRKSVV